MVRAPVFAPLRALRLGRPAQARRLPRRSPQGEDGRYDCAGSPTAEAARSDRAQCEFESRSAYQPSRQGASCSSIFHALSSEAERRSYKPKVEISKFSARTNRTFSSAAEHPPDKRKAPGAEPGRCTNLRALRTLRPASQHARRLPRRSPQGEDERQIPDQLP